MLPFGASAMAVAVSSGGGQARHFRVQYQPLPGSPWQRYASFTQPNQAQSCVRHLSRQGVAARIVHFAIVPAAG